MRSLALIVALTPHLLSAAIVDTRPLSPPLVRTEIVGAQPVAANDSGEYLTAQYRISADGDFIDQDPLAGAQGIPLGWGADWLTVRQVDRQIVIRKVPSRGASEDFLEFPTMGILMGAATIDDRVALLERRHLPQTVEVWVTVADESGIVQRRLLTTAEEAAITGWGGHFFVATAVRSDLDHSLVHSWKLDADGTPLAIDEGTEVELFPEVTISARDDRIIVVARTSATLTTIVEDASLAVLNVLHLDRPMNGYGLPALPIPTPDGFEVAYESNVLVLNSDGTMLNDGPAEPIATAGWFGERFLVVRPWGDAALAEGSPRNVITPALDLRRARRETETEALRTIVSEGVTLTLITRMASFPFYELHFTRVDQDGRMIDTAPQRVEAGIGVQVVAIPGGFGFVWRTGNGMMYRRLSTRGDWIDPVAKVLQGAWTTTATAAVAGETLLLAWSSPDELFTTPFTLGGDAMRSTPWITPASGFPSSLRLSGNGTRFLVLLSHPFQCNILCVPEDAPVVTLVFDTSGELIGPAQTVANANTVGAPVPLPDGTWVLPTNAADGIRIVHIGRDGSLLATATSPLLDQLPLDARATEEGWEAMLADPMRWVRFRGISEPAGILGLAGLEMPRFGSDQWLSYLYTETLEGIPGPWTGRVVSTPGDVSIQVTEITRAGTPSRFDITITNNGDSEATGLYLVWESSPLEIVPLYGTRLLTEYPLSSMDLPVLTPGSHVTLRGLIKHSGSHASRVMVLSRDLMDVSPADNFARAETSPPVRGRGRGTRR